MEINFADKENLDAVPEQFRSLFVEKEGGGFTLGEKFGGVAESLTGLNRSLKASRAEAKMRGEDALKPLLAFGGTADEILKGLQARQDEVEEQLADGSKAKLNLDKIKQELAQGYATQADGLNAQVKALTGQLTRELVDNKINSELTAAGAIKKAKFLRPLIRESISMIEEAGEYKTYVIDKQNDRRYSIATGQALTVSELVQEYKKDPEYGFLFESEAPAGGGMPPHKTHGMPPPRNGKKMSTIEKINAGLIARARQ